MTEWAINRMRAFKVQGNWMDLSGDKKKMCGLKYCGYIKINSLLVI